MKKILFLLILSTVCFSVIAQKQTGKTVYTDQVIDNKGVAVEYTTVVLLQEDRQKTGTVTDSMGYFHIFQTHTTSVLAKRSKEIRPNVIPIPKEAD